MNQNAQPIYRHVLAALVTNEPGVLSQVAGMFAARGFNIDSLVVGRTENPQLSRMTIVVNGDNAVLEQIRKQLQKLIPVVKVVDYKEAAFVERDLMLVKVNTTAQEQGTCNRSQLVELASLFRAKVVDVSENQLMIELAGSEEKIEAFVRLIKPFGIVEMARTGIIAISRGHAIATTKAPVAIASDPSADPTVDMGDLPPG